MSTRSLTQTLNLFDHIVSGSALACLRHVAHLKQLSKGIKDFINLAHNTQVPTEVQSGCVRLACL